MYDDLSYRVERGYIYLSGFLTPVTVFRKPNTIPLCFSIDLILNSKSKTIIDYIITKQDLKLKIQDVRAYRGPNCGTDYKLLVAKILFPYMYVTKDKHKEKKENTVTMMDKKRKYNIESLQN